VRIVDEIAHATGWMIEERLARTSHALAVDGRVWLFDVVDWPELDDRIRELGEPAAVVQLLDRHNRDSAAIAARLGVPRLVVPDALAATPFEIVPLVRWRRWREAAIWWPDRRILVTADAISTNPFFRSGGGAAAVHPLLRMVKPPQGLGQYEPNHLLVGHGEGIHGPEAAIALREALDSARTGLPRWLLGLPGALRSAN
jgi:hypothetical protein